MRQILKISELFSQLDDSALDEIASAAVTRKANRGEMLFSEGDPAHSFFIVGSGKVKVFKLSPEGKEQILMIAQTGDSVAEAALFAGGAFPASAQTMENSELLAINREKFVGLLGRNPDLAVNLIARLSGLLRQMTRLVEGLSLTDVTTRLAHYLSSQRESTGQQLVKITLSEKKTTLASQLGTIPETLSRSLAKLVREGVIAVDGPRITILNVAALHAYTESI
ncbi:MAG: Crp/Fnr family transcriptional regulator [bacterium]|nr:Crp/Fnr family transcriptional regulator [bacterium]